MYHVFYRPIYGIVPRAYNGTLGVFPSNKPRFVSGSTVNRSEVAKLLNQGNKS